MKDMLKFVQDEWEKDAVINKDDPAPLTVDQLHSKYWRFLSMAREEVIPLDQELSVLRTEKEQFFLHPTQEESKAKKWKYPAANKILKGDVKYYLAQDKDILDLEKRITMINIRIDFLEDTLKLIHYRGKRIETHVAWEKFKSGIS